MSRHEPELDCEESMNAAAYVLGALEDPEPYRKHLATCVACQAEVAELQRVVDSLPASVVPQIAPAALRDRVIETVRAEAELLQAAGPGADRPSKTERRLRTRRVPVLAASLAVAASAAAAAVIALNVGPTSGEHVTAGQVAASVSGARAALRQIGDRSELVVSGLPQPPLGKIYEIWLARPGASPRPTDVLFGVTSRGRGSVNVPNTLHGKREVLVTSEPIGGSAHPTSPPVIRVSVPA